MTSTNFCEKTSFESVEVLQEAVAERLLVANQWHKFVASQVFNDFKKIFDVKKLLMSKNFLTSKNVLTSKKTFDVKKNFDVKKKLTSKHFLTLQSF